MMEAFVKLLSRLYLSGNRNDRFCLTKYIFIESEKQKNI